MSGTTSISSGGTLPVESLRQSQASQAPNVVQSPPPQVGVQAPPPQMQAPVDRVRVQGNLADLDVASPADTRTFLQTHRDAVPNAIEILGNDIGIRVGGESIRISSQALGGHLAAGGVAETSKLGRALRVFAACQHANLPPSAAKAILNGFKQALEDGVSVQKAYQDAFAQISMAAMVESYVQNKDGLATDMRRISSFADDAFNAVEAGGKLKAYTNKTVRRDDILAQQANLDQALHEFTDAFASARLAGDYSAAFDALQSFFTTSARITDTNHWRMRASNPTSACPPLPDQQGRDVAAKLLDAAMERPPEARKLDAVTVADRGTKRRFVDSCKAIKQAIGSFFGRGTPRAQAAVGLPGVDAARQLVLQEGSVGARGAILNGAAPIGPTQAEATIQQAFGDKARSLIKKAAQGGFGTELLEVAKVAGAINGLDAQALNKLVGDKPTAASLTRLTRVLKTVAGTGTAYDANAASFVKRMMAKPALADQAAICGQAMRLTGHAYSLADVEGLMAKAVERVQANSNSTLEAVIIDRAIDKLGRELNPSDYSISIQVKNKVKTLAEMQQFLDTLEAMPKPLEISSAVAVALLPPDRQAVGQMRAQKLVQAVGNPSSMECADILNLLQRDVSAPIFERFTELAPEFRHLAPQSGRLDAVLDLARQLHEGNVPTVSREQLTTAVRLNRSVKDLPDGTLLRMLDSRAITGTFPTGNYQPRTVADVASRPPIGDLSNMSPTNASGAKSISVTAWWKSNDSEERILVKVPPGNEAFVPAHERMISVLGNQLGLLVNEVQIVPVGEVTAKTPGLNPEANIKYASLHVPVGNAPKALNEVWSQIGRDPKETDFRWPPGDKYCQSGQGCSSWLRSAQANYQELRNGITMVTLESGKRIRAGEPIPGGDREVSRHTYKIANPEMFDQTVAFDMLVGNADRHPGNVLMVPQESEDGTTTTYTVKLIDHGRVFFANAADDDPKQSRLEILNAYLRSLQLPGNEEHRDNVLPMLRTFANLSDKQLTVDPYAGIPDDGFEPGAKDKQIDLLRSQQAMVRAFLAELG